MYLGECVCMYVCMYVYVYTYVYIYICIYIHIYTYILRIYRHLLFFFVGARPLVVWRSRMEAVVYVLFSRASVLETLLTAQTRLVLPTAIHTWVQRN